MHEGHHGILDGVGEEHHNHDSHSCNACGSEKAPHGSTATSKNMTKTLGIIALSIVLVFLFRLIFN
jgi:hypothetical protein